MPARCVGMGARCAGGSAHRLWAPIWALNLRVHSVCKNEIVEGLHGILDLVVRKV